ncbi:MAG TPA: MXAN_2755 family glutamic-type intramembrane protease [Myxococcaceae bacterium]|nr:MXAN_2755 family glutamic-type intramembrane protease [Myxococcaceae bacterium]
MSAIATRWSKRTAVQEALALWAISFAAIVVTYAMFPKGYAKVVATVSFLYLPLWAMRQRGEDYRDYGVTLRRWRHDLKLFAILAAIGAPLYLGGYVAFAFVLARLPPHFAQIISPYPQHWAFHLRLPDRFDEWVIDQIFVVALPEEFFYRGFMQARLRDAWPQGRIFLGARLGPAFLVTAVLFALGHLAIFEVWRLAVFFPALLFGWMRERTGTVLGSALFHAACNLYELVLAASFFGRG